MKAIQITVYRDEDFTYTNYEYVWNQHIYTKTKDGEILDRNSTKEEFDNAKENGVLITRDIRKRKTRTGKYLPFHKAKKD